MKYALLCPGQGSQFVGMGKDLFSTSEFAKKCYHKASKILEFNLEDISFNGPNENLKKTQFTQPAIYVHSYISAIKLIKTKNISFSISAGHSLGEITALTIANVISFEDGLKLIKIRANSMAKAGEIQPGTMAAIIGANEDQINEICNQSEIVVPANINAPGQIVISGEINAIKSAIKTAKSIGIRRALPLNVSGAFHSPLMSSARDNLSEILNEIYFNDANFPIVQNITAKPETSGIKLKKNLLSQLENPVKWSDTIECIYNLNIDHFIECGPGKILSGLNRRILKNSVNFNIGTTQEINEFES